VILRAGLGSSGGAASWEPLNLAFFFLFTMDAACALSDAAHSCQENVINA
jgi:hypothetical protein